MKRTFIAIRIIPDDKMIKILEHLQERLSGEKIKWIAPDILHITLFFLGDTKDDLIPAIGEKLKQLSREFSPFDLEFRGIGVFKNFRDPRIIWIGTQENPAVKALKSRIDEELTEFGFEAEKREFRPHLTIGRIKWIRNISVLEEMVKFYKNQEVQRSGINGLIFFESILKQNGPEYIPLLKTPLGQRI